MPINNNVGILLKIDNVIKNNSLEGENMIGRFIECESYNNIIDRMSNGTPSHIMGTVRSIKFLFFRSILAESVRS
ncbi:hypothetical protein QA612_06820 [Evansella sp. AB-P1]|uniref:hypothetical protein n=1 Tax=Evansella sp. AB-P1 TaxID=3037653 RepID=UPI00241F78D6|nr:hypothetical protein [Evansella sp. AB-P1]MDG5787200.1 hypothetical protein [Evansella sp. AB-P1]